MDMYRVLINAECWPNRHNEQPSNWTRNASGETNPRRVHPESGVKVEVKIDKLVKSAS